MLALTDASELSTLEDEVDTLLELALTVESVKSRLDDDCERFSDEVRLVEMLALTELRELSTLEDDVDIESELLLIAESAASTLEDEFDKLRLEV